MSSRAAASRRRMLLRCAALVGVCALTLTAGCRRGGGGGGGLECGDARQALSSSSAWVVNGSDRWDPSVVALTTGQSLAVGALMSPTRGGGWSTFCTGTLVGPQVVLTAAHCVYQRRGEVLAPEEVGFGIGTEMQTPLAVLEPSAVYADPRYSSRGGAEHDVAVLIFDAPASDSVAEIEPIPVNRGPLDGSVIGQTVQTVGFGCTDSNCFDLNTRKWWAIEDLVDVSAVDLLIDGNGVAGVCYGDSGGPALWTMPDGVVRVIGTLSWGDSDCGNQDHFARTDTEYHFLAAHLPSCGTLTEAGVCEGTVARWCENDAPASADCGPSGQVCAPNADGHNRCVDPCAGETLEGRCDGDDLIWCESGEVKVRRCGECGQRCGAAAGVGFDCLDD